jgi:hypothetical protein
VASNINFGGQEIISTWVLKEDMNIHKKGKTMGMRITNINMKKKSLKAQDFFTAGS